MEKHENTLATSQREQFGSRIAFVLASMGGAIGLAMFGNFRTWSANTAAPRLS